MQDVLESLYEKAFAQGDRPVTGTDLARMIDEARIVMALQRNDPQPSCLRFPFTPEDLQQIRDGIVLTMCTVSGGIPNFAQDHNNTILSRALRALRTGRPNIAVSERVLRILYESAWVAFRTAERCGRDNAGAHRAAVVHTQAQLEFHLRALEHVTVGEYRDDA